MADAKQITKNLDKQKIVQMGAVAAQQARKFYDENTPLCDEAYAYYSNYTENKNIYVDLPVFRGIDFLRKEYSAPAVLLLTSNEIEEGVLLHFLSERTGSPLPTYIVGSQEGRSYHIAKMEEDLFVHVHTESTGDNAMRRSINYAAQIFNISHILLLGICYGIDHDKQSMCSPIIANEVVGYHIDFRDDETGETQFVPVVEFREKPAPTLIGSITNIFRGCAINGRLLAHNKEQPIRPTVGTVLSATCLMSSSLVKNSILTYIGNTKPQPSGGEMEGCGIFKTRIFEENGFKNWLIIKSICDWGAGKNSLCPDDQKLGDEIKNSLQALAMINTCEVFRQLLDFGILTGEATR